MQKLSFQYDNFCIIFMGKNRNYITDAYRMSASTKTSFHANNCTDVIDKLSESAYAIASTNTTFGAMANAANKGSMTEALVSILDHKISFCEKLQKISDDHSFVKPKVFGSSKSITVNTDAVSQHQRNLEKLRHDFLTAGGITALSGNREVKASNKKLIDDWKKLQLNEVSDILRSQKGSVKHLHEDALPSYGEATGSNNANQAYRSKEK